MCIPPSAVRLLPISTHVHTYIEFSVRAPRRRRTGSLPCKLARATGRKFPFVPSSSSASPRPHRHPAGLREPVPKRLYYILPDRHHGPRVRHWTWNFRIASSARTVGRRPETGTLSLLTIGGRTTGVARAFDNGTARDRRRSYDSHGFGRSLNDAVERICAEPPPPNSDTA